MKYELLIFPLKTILFENYFGLKNKNEFRYTAHENFIISNGLMVHEISWLSIILAKQKVLGKVNEISHNCPHMTVSMTALKITFLFFKDEPVTRPGHHHFSGHTDLLTNKAVI